MSGCDFLYKVVVLGDSGVGKSNLIFRFTKNIFNTQPKPTIGVEFASKSIAYDGVTIKGQIWDTAGQERFQSVSVQYHRGAHGALMVYDITNKETFDHLEKWFTEISKQGEEGCMYIIIGNKCDLAGQRQVTEEEGKKFAEKKNLLFMETSALNSTNVEEAFSVLLKNIYHTRKQASAHHHTNNGDDILEPIRVPPPSIYGSQDDIGSSYKVSLDVQHQNRMQTSALQSKNNLSCCK